MQFETISIEKLSPDHFLLKSIIDSYREDWQRESGQRDKEPRHHFYISDVSKCDREIYYFFKHPEEKRTIADKTLVLFRMGNIVHEEIQFRLRQKRLVDNSRDLEYGVEDWEIETTGRLDSFIKEDSGLAVTEIKGKNPYGFKVETPVKAEIEQLQWYIYSAKESKALSKRNILDYGYILYVEGWPMSDFPIIGWKVEYDPLYVNGIRKRFIELKIKIDAEEIPQRQFERDSIKCSYCRFKEFCWRGIPEIKVPALKADESIEKPEQELVESAEKRFVELKKQIEELEEEYGNVRDILIKYFKATGSEETELLKFIFVPRTALDVEYLAEHLQDKWHLFSIPQAKLLQQAIKDGKVDPEIFERAKRVVFTDQIRIKKGE